MIYFTSDQHFSDDRLHLFSRPFESASDVNSAIISNYNDMSRGTKGAAAVGTLKKDLLKERLK